jgi:hypothetical protein
MDKTQTLKFLNEFFPTCFHQHGFFVELRFIREGRPVCQKFLPIGGTSDSDLQDIEALNAEYNVFFGVCPRPNDHATKDADIMESFCLWADIDGKDYDPEHWEKGKAEARRRLAEFQPAPGVIVDSGHGWQCYWLMKEAMDISSPEKQIALRQVLFGIVKALGGDTQRMNPSSMMRLPGTVNIKHLDEPERYYGPADCTLDMFERERVWTLDDFAKYIDPSYEGPKVWDGDVPAFGHKRKIISFDSEAQAIADAKALEVRRPTQNRIIHGTMLQGKTADRTASGRDMSIIVTLIFGNYDYPTIKSIFFNPFLKCSARIMKAGEAKLRYDVIKALDFVRSHKVELSQRARHILDIKTSTFVEQAEKPIQIDQYVVRDLFEGPSAGGIGFRKRGSSEYYFFDQEDKEMMNLEGLDFYLYMRDRFSLVKRDFDEIKDAVKTAIQMSRAEVEPHNFAYFDPQRYVLYVSNNANQIYRIDGQNITTCDNGVDGVFFECDVLMEPFQYRPDIEVVNYFSRQVEAKKVVSPEMDLTFPAALRLGFSLKRFQGSLLDEFLVSRASFDEDEKHRIAPEEQKFLFALHFYTLFFQSIQEERPIIVFVGQKSSGKSFIATSIGKILFGSAFGPSPFPGDEKDLMVVLGGSHYVVFDNLDGPVGGKNLNALCAAATSAKEMKRTLYTDREQTQFFLNAFVAITSREPKFRREDAARRLLLFFTREITREVGRSDLWRSLLERRGAIMTEVLVNLNSVVAALKERRDEPSWPCVSGMIADWEALLKKMCSVLPEALMLRECLWKMGARKVSFALEEEPVYWILRHIVYELSEHIEKQPMNELFGRFQRAAMELGYGEFEKKYASAMSMSKRIKSLRRELEKEFRVEIETRKTAPALYSFGPLEESVERGPKQEEPRHEREPGEEG